MSGQVINNKLQEELDFIFRKQIKDGYHNPDGNPFIGMSRVMMNYMRMQPGVDIKQLNKNDHLMYQVDYHIHEIEKYVEKGDYGSSLKNHYLGIKKKHNFSREEIEYILTEFLLDSLDNKFLWFLWEDDPGSIETNDNKLYNIESFFYDKILTWYNWEDNLKVKVKLIRNSKLNSNYDLMSGRDEIFKFTIVGKNFSDDDKKMTSSIFYKKKDVIKMLNNYNVQKFDYKFYSFFSMIMELDILNING